MIFQPGRTSPFFHRGARVQIVRGLGGRAGGHRFDDHQERREVVVRTPRFLLTKVGWFIHGVKNDVFECV